MDINQLKIELQKQAMSFNSDVERKLQALISGKNMFKSETVLYPSEPVSRQPESVSRETLYDSFLTSKPRQNEVKDNSGEEQNVVSRLMRLRGISLPGDYLHKN